MIRWMIPTIISYGIWWIGIGGINGFCNRPILGNNGIILESLWDSGITMIPFFLWNLYV